MLSRDSWEWGGDGRQRKRTWRCFEKFPAIQPSIHPQCHARGQRGISTSAWPVKPSPSTVLVIGLWVDPGKEQFWSESVGKQWCFCYFHNPYRFLYCKSKGAKIQIITVSSTSVGLIVAPLFHFHWACELWGKALSKENGQAISEYLLEFDHLD